MAEDPVTILLRQHFKKVNECLLDKQNFDILTKFRSTCDKAIDDSDSHTEEEYVNSELELSLKEPGKSLPGLERFQQMSMENIESEEFQTETDFEECSIERDSSFQDESSVCTYYEDFESQHERSRKHGIIQDEDSEASSSVLTFYEDCRKLNENKIPSTVQPSKSEESQPKVSLNRQEFDTQETTPPDQNLKQSVDQSKRKYPRKSLSERPQTPMLEMYDSEEEEFHETSLKKMEGSQKFVLSMQQLQAGDLNCSIKEAKCDRFIANLKLLDELPKKEDVCSSIPTPRENEEAFHSELEMYKRDIKLEKTIKSLSYNDENNKSASPINQPCSSSCSQCPKIHYHLNKTEIEEKPLENHHFFNERVGKNCSHYLRNQGRKTNVCQKLSRTEGLEDASDNLRKISSDGIFEGQQEILSNFELSANNDDYKRYTLPDNDYVSLNHFEIQKEMMKRIEEMYKPGDE